ncbi:MAG: isoleucine--tRNA ligase [Candidatus Omnitrophica bacterium]|nr:isoleucine--tRNA ligase [Candidatus Omnitrophota bacterium]
MSEDKKINLKNTLNLPKTLFPMKANLTQVEPKILSYWNKLEQYQLLCERTKDREKFILHDGPPYANGRIHIGHALNKILKDIIIKYKFMKGFNAPFIIGWDCHGLPVEHQLFKELKKTKHDVDVSDFRKKAKAFALKHVEMQKDDFKKLGIFCDWDNPYLTVNPDYEYGVLKLLESLVDDGYVYRGRKPVNWCPSCETALAEAEVEYADKESDSIYFLFKVAADKGVFGGVETHFLVWTTTPWTLISNVAVALHPEFDYCLTEFDGKRIMLAKDLIPALEKKFDCSFKILDTFSGKKLENLKLRHPFLDRDALVVLADYISKEEGSGCVHIAPGHGQDDFSLTKKYPLEIIMGVNDKGIFCEPEEFKGRNISEVNKLVINKLSSNNCLIKHQKIKHSYPHCWRCKNPIIFRATYQWFLNVDHKGLRNKAMGQLDSVEWIPSTGKERMTAMLFSRPDWCLSRQRLWGIPIPAVKCRGCQNVELDKAIISKTADVFKKEGSDAWFSSPIEVFLPKDYKCRVCGCLEFEKEFDILDVWFESGASFFSVVMKHPQLRFPADMYLEGSDQHRGWFQVSLIPSVAREGKMPFKRILTHGFVVDGEGRKMSKSMGNVIAPQEISKKYGSEILRLWVAFSDYSEDVKISQDIIKQLVDIYRKVRNTIRFILGNTYDFNPRQAGVTYQQLLEVDKYMLSKSMVVYDEVMKLYEGCSFYKVTAAIFNFCNLDLSSFYLDFLKDRLYTFSAESLERRSAQFVLYHVLRLLVNMISPILSFTAEEVYLAWENLHDKKETVFLSSLDDSYTRDWINKPLMARWDKIISLRADVLREIEKEREKGNIGSSLEARILLRFNDIDYSFYKDYESQLRELFIVSNVEVEKGDSLIAVTKASGKKCLRCWNWRADTEDISGFGDVCGRCREVLKEIDVKFSA